MQTCTYFVKVYTGHSFVYEGAPCLVMLASYRKLYDFAVMH